MLSTSTDDTFTEGEPAAKKVWVRGRNRKWLPMIKEATSEMRFKKKKLCALQEKEKGLS
jgi:hypothetical protein